MKRIQRLPETLWTHMPLDDKNYYVFYYDKTGKHRWQATGAKVALQKMMDAEKKGFGAFATGPIPCNENQHGVFAYSAAGCTQDFIRVDSVNDLVTKAYRSVFGKVETQPSKTVIPIQKIKNDKIVLVCKATIDEDIYGKEYTFLADEELFVNDKRTAHLKSGEYKAVTIVEKTKAVPVSQLDHPLEWYVTLCTYLLEEHREEVKEVPEEYEENIEELKAMKECFEPACDYVVNPNPDGYTFDQPDNYDYYDYDDLPE